MKLFASDFDGTFFFHEKNQIFFDNIKATKEFQKENKFAFVTGRAPQSIQYNIKSEGFNPDYIAGYNGGIICDSKFNVLYEDFPQLNVSAIMNVLKEENVKSFSFFSKDKMFVKYYCAKIADHKFMKYYANQNGTKITYSLNKTDLNSIAMATVVCKDEIQSKRVCEKIAALNMKCNAFVNKHCIDIVSQNASKKNAVEFISKHMNASEVYTIGDSYNDVSMIEHYYGFTLQHANEDNKKKAKCVVESVSEAIKNIT